MFIIVFIPSSAERNASRKIVKYSHPKCMIRYAIDSIHQMMRFIGTILQ